jgi:hypothetical protein
MASLDLDHLFVLTNASPLLDNVETALRTSGKTALADGLVKLQQDAGIDLQREMGLGDLLDTPAGPQTAALTKAHEELTPARLGLLADCHNALPDGDLKTGIADLVRQLPSPFPAVSAPAAAPRRTG